MINPVNKSHVGYTGIFRQPYANTEMYGPTLYAITNEIHSEINLLVLCDGFYNDAYRILVSTTFRKVHIFIPSLGIQFISDVFRLVTDLKRAAFPDKAIYWHYPIKYTTTNPTNVLFEMSQLLDTKYVSESIPALSITMEEEKGIGLDGIYNFIVVNGKMKELFTLGMTKEEVQAIPTGTYDRIHMPYCTFYGASTTARELGCIDKGLIRNVVPNNFRNTVEFYSSKDTGFMNQERIRL